MDISTVSSFSLIISSFVAFVSGLLESTVGASGFIYIPILSELGIHTKIAISTGQFLTLPSVLISSLLISNSLKKKRKSNVHHNTSNLNISYIIIGMIASSIGGVIGAYALSKTPDKTVSIVISIVLFTMLVTRIWFKFIKKNQLSSDKIQKRLTMTQKIIMFFICNVIIGVYDGFCNVGSKMLIIFAMEILFLMPTIEALRYALLINFGSCISSVITYVIKGNYNIQLLIIFIPIAILGAYCGGRLITSKNGEKFINILFTFMASIIVIRYLFLHLAAH